MIIMNLTSSFFNFFAAESPLLMGELGLRPFCGAAVTVSEVAVASDLGLDSERGEIELVL